MRKNPIILLMAVPALLALSLASSCCRDKVSADEDGPAILLGVSQAGTTKGLIDAPLNTDRIRQMMAECYDAQGHRTGGFGVHGYKSIRSSGTSIKLFDNVRIYPDMDESAEFNDLPHWIYTPLRYWDSNPEASYQFLAYWPWITATESSSAPYATVNDGSKILTLHNIPNWQVADAGAMDFMTATRVGTYAENFSSGIVTFSFRHLLSQLVIKAYYVGISYENEGQSGVSINSITLNESAQDANDVLSGKSDGEGNGATDFTQRYDSINATAASLDDDMAASYTLPGSSGPINYMDELEMDPDFVPVTLNSWLTVPHVWKNINLVVNYTVNTNDARNSLPVPITLGAVSDSYRLLPGKTYVITLLIDTSDGGVILQSLAVQDWHEHDITREYNNW